MVISRAMEHTVRVLLGAALLSACGPEPTPPAPVGVCAPGPPSKPQPPSGPEPLSELQAFCEKEAATSWSGDECLCPFTEVHGEVVRMDLVIEPGKSPVCRPPKTRRPPCLAERGSFLAALQLGGRNELARCIENFFTFNARNLRIRRRYSYVSLEIADEADTAAVEALARWLDANLKVKGSDGQWYFRPLFLR